MEKESGALLLHFTFSLVSLGRYLQQPARIFP